MPENFQKWLFWGGIAEFKFSQVATDFIGKGNTNLFTESMTENDILINSVPLGRKNRISLEVMI